MGVLVDEQSPAWTFHEGYEDAKESWKQVQSPQTWMTLSCFWYSKLISLQLGLDAIAHYLAFFEYGNEDLSGGLAAPGLHNPAWVSSSLKITALEQTSFVQKMLLGYLPVSPYAVAKTKSLLFIETLPNGWKLYGKTGGSTHQKDDGSLTKVIWFVGWIANGEVCFPFTYHKYTENFIDVQPVARTIQILAESKVMELDYGYRSQ